MRLPFGLSGTGGHAGLLGWTLTFQIVAVVLVVAGPFDASPLLVRVGIFAAFGFSFAAWIGAVVRRLHDMGRSGWFAMLFPVPVVGLGLLIWALVAPSRPVDPERFHRAPRYLVGGALLALLALVITSRAVWSPHRVISDHMEPTLAAGSVFLTYDYDPAAIERGMVISYAFPDDSGTERLHIARVAALPGDTIALRGGVPVIDGVVANHLSCPEVSGCLVETLPSGARYRILDGGATARDDTAPARVPEGMMFLLGDNRDVARDSRLSPEQGGKGFVPLSAVRGHVLSWASVDQP